MTQYRVPEFCDPNKKDIGKNNVESKRLLPRSVIERNICLYIHKKQFCLIGKKNREDSLVNGVEEIKKNCNCKQVNNRINEDDLGQ